MPALGRSAGVGLAGDFFKERWKGNGRDVEIRGLGGAGEVNWRNRGGRSSEVGRGENRP